MIQELLAGSSERCLHPSYHRRAAKALGWYAPLRGKGDASSLPVGTGAMWVWMRWVEGHSTAGSALWAQDFSPGSDFGSSLLPQLLRSLGPAARGGSSRGARR